ncbi:FG-GAP repeat domain-containing protein [Bdellovibrio sp. HCB337]|uniref:FG-GAP repeat domain-containing protein n=1 Tax=Bdellovibrio sp. HCB337 TaxID=3394358 RepID=UPI0039A69754
MKKQSVATLLILSAVTIVSYQNCANQMFQQEIKFESASNDSQEAPPPPMCRKIEADEVKPKLLYAWDYANDAQPAYDQVMASPVVGDLDGDKIPEIAFVSYEKAAYSAKGVLRVLNGKTGAAKFSVSADALMPYASTAPLLVDIDKDGKTEIVYLHYLGKKVIALNYDGSLRWEYNLDFTGTGLTSVNNCRAGFAAADIDGDGRSEIIAGSWILTEAGDKTPLAHTRLAEVTTSCSTYAVSLSNAANSALKIIGTTGAMDTNGNYLWKFKRSGLPATADLLPDVPGIEVVVTGGGFFSIYNGLTGEVIADKTLSEHSELICRYDANKNPIVGGGQATIGDFDGVPSTLEIAVATGKSLTIFNARGEKVAGSVTQDCSSLITGLTSFDFNGDGKPEIIYADENYIRIYGMDGSNNLNIIWSEINPSWTLLEYPVVADVTGDGYAELVVVSNNYNVNNLYQNEDDKAKAKLITGLRVYTPTSDRAWMPTRSVWNQHAYLATNVNDDLTATSSTMINGFTANLFKRNIQKGLLQQTCTTVQ